MKTSAEAFSERFEREAQAIAALNHPHICILYDVGPDHLVMEYVEGAAIEGPLPLDLALRYGVQLASAVEATHCKGIMHRDLKPANILVGAGGVKLLDFGLAKVPDQPPKPTRRRTMSLTEAGDQQRARDLARQFSRPDSLTLSAAMSYAAAGEADKMFEALENAYQRRDLYLLNVKRAPVFDRYRDDPRYRNLLLRMNLAAD